MGLLALLAIISAGLFSDGSARADGHIRELVAFEERQFPEGLSVSPDGTILVGILSTGEVVRVTPNGTAGTLGQLPLPAGGLLVGIHAVDSSNVFALLNTEDESNGVWHVGQQGVMQIAQLPPGLLNDIVADSSGRLLVTDSVGGRIYAVHRDGSVETWAEDPLLLGNVDEPGPLGFPVGANGIVLTPGGDAAYVAVSEKARIVRIEIAADGSAGQLSVTATDPVLGGADGLDLSSDGTLYVAVNGQNQIVAVDTASGSVEVLAAGEPFRFPAVARLSPDENTLYVTNFDGLVMFGLAEGPAMTGLLAMDLSAFADTKPPSIQPPATGSGGLTARD